MPTEILAVGTGEASSADVTVDEGDQLTVALKAAEGIQLPYNARVKVLLKDDDGEYFEQFELSCPNRLGVVIVGAGTYQFRRIASSGACGVFSG